MSRRHAAAALLSVFMGSTGLHAQTSASADQPLVPQEPSGPPARVALRFKDRPSIRFGNLARLDLRVKLQGDVRDLAEPDRKDETFELSRRRLSVQGDVLGRVAFEVEREINDKDPWRDVFVEARAWQTVRVRAGQFKVPFGLERLTSSSELDFVERALASDAIAPGRDVGLTIEGRPLGRTLTYTAGLFRRDGGGSRSGDATGGGRTYVVRVTGRPLAAVSLPSGLRRLELGGAVAVSDLPEGPNSLEGETLDGFTAFTPVYVSGTRRRVEGDANWRQGPFSAQAEFLQARDTRNGQSLSGGDLSDLVTEGWYAGGGWIVTGEAKKDIVQPRRGLLAGGTGAIELAIRAERLRFSSAARSGPAFRNPRAEHVLPNEIRNLTLGVNWYLTRFVRLQLNAIRESVSDAERRPDPTRDARWHRTLRVQFAM